jgi:hypothetical protein
MGALLCDAAHEYNGLVSVLGGFVSLLNVAQLPAVSLITFAARVGFGSDELNVAHEITLIVSAPDSTHLVEVQARLSLTSGAVVLHEDMAQGVNLIIPLPFGIAAPGVFWVELFIDGEGPMVRLPLKVVMQAPLL